MSPLDEYMWGMHLKLLLGGRRGELVKHLRLLHRETVEKAKMKHVRAVVR